MGRPAKALISKESAARAALDVIDERGLGVLSLELVAKRLGVKAPSLYHHFQDKAELLAEVARMLLVDVEIPPEPRRDWRTNIVALSVATRRSILDHPNAAALLLQFFPRHLLLGGYNLWVATLPLPIEQRMILIEGLEKFTFGSALFEAASRARGVPSMPTVDPQRFPNLAASVQANKLDGEAVFIATVNRLIDGFFAQPGGAPPEPIDTARRSTTRQRTTTSRALAGR